MKRIAILGSTGSIGTQTLEVVKNFPGDIEVISLVAYSNESLLSEQVAAFKPKFSALVSQDGEGCLLKAVANCDVAVVATRGIIAVDAVLDCLRRGTDVALANKETLVTAGKLVADALKNSSARLLPVDSEHSAIWQCLESENTPSKVYLTASGGAFYGMTAQQLQNVSAADALKHPNWNMGAKITVDSATMMNKAFEVVEAKWLFDLRPEDIEIVVHRQSIVHSMVQFADGSVKAQLAAPDMRSVIQYALTYPTRKQSFVSPFDVTSCGALTFEKCDYESFPCAKFGHFILNSHPLMGTVVNAANDICVQAFLEGRIKYLQIYEYVADAANIFTEKIAAMNYSLESIKTLDRLVKDATKTKIGVV